MSEVIANIKIVVKAMGGGTSDTSLTTSPDASHENDDDISHRGTASRDKCRERDGHRCIISGWHDGEELQRLRRVATQEGDKPVVDSDGEEISAPYTTVEVAHIVPFSLANPSVSRLYYIH